MSDVAARAKAELEELDVEIAALTERITAGRVASSRQGAPEDVDLDDLGEDLKRLRSRKEKLQTRLKVWSSAETESGRGEPELPPLPASMAEALEALRVAGRKVALRVGEVAYLGTIDSVGTELVRVKINDTFPQIHPSLLGVAVLALASISAVQEPRGLYG